MKRLLALATLLSSLSIADKNTNARAYDVGFNDTRKNIKSYRVDVVTSMDGMHVKKNYIGDVIAYDVDGDKKEDVIHLIRYDRNGSGFPIIYYFEKSINGYCNGGYIDVLENGLNGNEIRCNDFNECLERIVDMNRLTAWLTDWKANRFKLA